MMEMAVKPNTYKYPVTESKWTPPSFHSSFPECSDTAESTKTDTRHLSDKNQGAECNASLHRQEFITLSFLWTFSSLSFYKNYFPSIKYIIFIRDQTYKHQSFSKGSQALLQTYKSQFW